MLLKLMVMLGLIAAGVVGRIHLMQPDPLQICLARTAAFQEAYTKDRPKSESGPSDLRRSSSVAERFCREGQYDEAARVVATSSAICRLNNGCSTIR